MKVLIACEYSGTVRDAFIAKGHDAISCDLLPTETPGPHYQGDIFDIINDGFDLMIAHPPCTYLSYAATGVWHTPGRARKRLEALDFFLSLWEAPIEKICLENPQGCIDAVIEKHTQTIQPWHFGEPMNKRTNLWLKNLPKLLYHKSDNLFGEKTTVEPVQLFSESGRKKVCTDVMGGGSGDKRRKNRAKFFKGIAEAMADQWGGL